MCMFFASVNRPNRLLRKHRFPQWVPSVGCNWWILIHFILFCGNNGWWQQKTQLLVKFLTFISVCMLLKGGVNQSMKNIIPVRDTSYLLSCCCCFFAVQCTKNTSHTLWKQAQHSGFSAKLLFAQITCSKLNL